MLFYCNQRYPNEPADKRKSTFSGSLFKLPIFSNFFNDFYFINNCIVFVISQRVMNESSNLTSEIFFTLILHILLINLYYRIAEDIKYKFSGSLLMGGQYHYTMETQTCYCVPVEDGMDIYPATQWIAAVQQNAAVALNIPENRYR